MQEQAKAGLPLFWTPTLTQYVALTVIGPDGDVLGRFDMEAKLVAGRCLRALAFDDPEFRAIGDRYAAELAEAAWRGPVSVQMVQHPKLGFQTMEFCARVSGGMYPRTLLGFDEMALLLSAWTKTPFVRTPPLGIAALALRVTRDVGLDTGDCRVLRENGTWTSS